MTAGVDDAQPGLRERSKARRRLEIQQAGMRLFAEKGYANTTVVEIAAAADVAPRTVSGYFATKVEIATAFSDDIARSLTQRLAADPAADLVSVLDTWLLAVSASIDTETAALTQAMYAANPELGALSSAHVADAAEAGRLAVARRSGLPSDHPMVEIALSAVGAVLAQYLRAGFSAPASPQTHESVVAFLCALLDALGV